MHYIVYIVTSHAYTASQQYLQLSINYSKCSNDTSLQYWLFIIGCVEILAFSVYTSPTAAFGHGKLIKSYSESVYTFRCRRCSEHEDGAMKVKVSQGNAATLKVPLFRKMHYSSCRNNEISE